ncbi:guanine nucleotide exchange factor [Kalaharituber pfeilii]|nr:guanine nucleotide exchange factor [Kalaharituber pfeilii]
MSQANTNAAADNEKSQRVQELLSILAIDLQQTNLSPAERLKHLEELKVFSRESNCCNLMYAEDGIRTLCAHAFERSNDWESSREALRCLANSLVLSPAARQTFVDLGYPDKASNRYSSESLDDEFLLGRILLLITYVKVDVKRLLEEQNLAEHLNNAIQRHSKRYSKAKASKTPSPMEDLALAESLKLLFNVTHFASDCTYLFNETIPHLLEILIHIPLMDPPLQPPVTYIVNALSNVQLSGNKYTVFPPSDPSRSVVKFMDILDGSLHKKYLDINSNYPFDDEGSVLLGVLGEIYKIAPQDVKACMRARLLPTPEERDKPLGRGNTLSARLLNLTTAALAPRARVIAGQLLFTLSDSDASQFINNVGYGFASGFLVSHGIPVPKSAMEENATIQGGEWEGTPINPVTGQTLSAEQRDQKPLEEMTDDEKMREAERLFVLFERLKKTGVVTVKNPVEQAIEEGRFEELD